MTRHDRTVLGAMTDERGWDRRKFDQMFRAEAAKVAQRTGTPETASLSVSDRSYVRWRRYGSGRPRGACALVLESLFGHPVAHLFAHESTRGETTPAALARIHPPSLIHHGGDDPGEGTGINDLAAELTAAARESTTHAALTASAALEPPAIDQLHDDVAALARVYPQRAPLAVHTEARQLRDLAMQLLGRTGRPAQSRDLYVIAGKATSLLAAAAFDLGATPAATAQARAAWLYGHTADHNGLCAWARGMEALIHYWSGDPDRALRIVQEARRHAGSGTALIRLLTIEARAWGHLGNRSGVDGAIKAARRERDRSYPSEDLHDRTGGEFAFGPARQERSHGTAYLDLGDPQQALNQAKAALALVSSRNAPATPRKVLAQAHADMAAAHVFQHDLDAAEAALDHVLPLGPEHRVHGINQRLRTVARALREPNTHNRSAEQIHDNIRAFLSVSPTPVIG